MARARARPMVRASIDRTRKAEYHQINEYKITVVQMQYRTFKEIYFEK